MKTLAFDEATHTYLLGGVKVPSVTQVMKPLYDFSAVNLEVLRRAGEFGTAVHKTIELYLLDNLDEDSLDSNLYNPLLAFKAWQADHYDFDLTCASIEIPHCHQKLKFAGTPDIDAEPFVIDIKSRACNLLNDAIQLAAYDHLTGKGRRQRFVLELKQDASYVFTDLSPDRSDLPWRRFRYLLDYHNMTQEINQWRKP